MYYHLMFLFNHHIRVIALQHSVRTDQLGRFIVGNITLYLLALPSVLRLVFVQKLLDALSFLL